MRSVLQLSLIHIFVNAIDAANKEVDRIHQLNVYQIQAIADKIAGEVARTTHAVNVEDIQEMVETGIMEIDVYKRQEIMRSLFSRS